RRTAILSVVLDAEISVRSGRIVAGREDDATERPIFADQIGGRGRRKEAVLPDQNTAEAVGGRHADGGLYHFAIVEATVPAETEGLTRESLQGVEDRLDKVLGVVPLLKHRDLLTQSGGAGSLSLEGDRRDGSDHRIALCFSCAATTAAPAPDNSRKSMAYCPALRCHETSARMPRRCMSRHTFWSRKRLAARISALSKDGWSTGENWTPVATPAASAASFASMMVSASPPTRDTTGIQP